MAEIVRMPKLSDTMTEGVIVAWYKNTGDKVKQGELLAEIETDKATMEFESYFDGVLLYIGVEKGKAVPVDTILAIIGKEDEDFSVFLNEKTLNNEQKTTKQTDKKEMQSGQEIKKPLTQEDRKTGIPEGRIIASPLAKKLAKEKGVKLSGIAGTGDDGRIVRRDIEKLSISPPVALPEGYHDEDVSQMRKTIAKRLAESKFSAPHYYLTVEIDMNRAMDVRNSINNAHGLKLSFNDLIVKAAAMALRKHPKVNASWVSGSGESSQVKLRYFNHIHIGVAVAVEEGLVVPVIRFADSKTLSHINSDIKVFSSQAKSKKLQPPDMEGSTFTVSNLGMYGIEEFTAIINPPGACILAVGAIRQKPVIHGDKVVPGNVMKVTLSCDHRVVDGATGADFLKTFKSMLENPVLFLGANSI